MTDRYLKRDDVLAVLQEIDAPTYIIETIKETPCYAMRQDFHSERSDVPLDRITVNALQDNDRCPAPRRELDEYVCSCGVRWSTDETAPACPSGRVRDI